MSAGDRDTLAELLAEYLPVSLAPSKETGPEWLISGWSDLRAVADVLLASDWLREQRTEAWKAGHGWCDDGIDGMCDHEPFTPSPYLED